MNLTLFKDKKILISFLVAVIIVLLMFHSLLFKDSSEEETSTFDSNLVVRDSEEEAALEEPPVQEIFDYESFIESTKPLYPETPEERARLQVALDVEYAQSEEAFLTKYPMYSFLPIEKDNYRISYSLELSKYRIRILKPFEEISIAERSSIIQEALEDIRQKSSQDNFDYYVLYLND